MRSQLIILTYGMNAVAAAAAKSLQSCPTLCNPIDKAGHWLKYTQMSLVIP